MTIDKNEKGSIAITGMIVMLFMLVVIGALAPYITTEVKASRLNQDVVEAQFVAEAGIKRAVVGFMHSRTDWNWANGTTRTIFQDGTDKAYSVSISPPIINGSVPAPGTYIITSTGFVGDINKIIKVEITLSSGGGGNEELDGSDVFSKYVIYDKNRFYMYGGAYPKITGQIGLAASSDVSIDFANQFLNDMVFGTVKVPGGWRSSPDWLTSNNLYKQIENVGTLKINMPAIPNLTNIDIPTSNVSGGAVFSSPGTYTGSEYYSAALSDFGGSAIMKATKTKIYAFNGIHLTNKGSYSNGSIVGEGDLEIYANGNINLSNGSFITSSGNITIYTNDWIKLSGGSYIKSDNGKVKIIAKNKVELSDSNNYIASTSGNVEISSVSGSIEFNQNGCYVNGKKVVLNAGDTIKLSNGGSINNSAGYESSTAFLYAVNAITTNSFAIGGAASLFLITNKFDINNTFSAPKTVFVSSSQESAISGTPKLAGIYTNGALTISGTPTIAYDTNVMTALGLNGGGGSGSPTVTIGNWSK